MILTKVMKQMWKYDGFIMSDWGATHSTTLAANAGLDQEMGLNDGQYFGNPLKNAVNSNQVSQATVDDKITRILYKMYAFGIMDNNPPENHNGDVTSPAHNLIARQLVSDSTVLLKNDNDILPLKRSARVAVVGTAGT
eukprot:UN06143